MGQRQRHGWVQQQIIVQLMEINNLTVTDLCSVTYHCHPNQPTKSQKWCVQNALSKLVAQKIVKRGGFTHNGEQCWTFLGTNADRTGERLHKLRAKQRIARKPRLIKPEPLSGPE